MNTAQIGSWLIKFRMKKHKLRQHYLNELAAVRSFPNHASYLTGKHWVKLNQV